MILPIALLVCACDSGSSYPHSGAAACEVVAVAPGEELPTVVIREQADMQALRNCWEVRANVTIEKSNLTNLAGLEGVQRITGSLTIRENDKLTSLSGLEGLMWVQELHVLSNPDLVDLDGVKNVTFHSDSTETEILLVEIDDNASLRTLAGLRGLQEAFDLTISRNPLLTDLQGLENLARLGEFMSIKQNARLSTLSALSRKIRCGELDCLGIYDNPVLSNCEALDFAEEVGLSGFFGGNDDSECGATGR